MRKNSPRREFLEKNRERNRERDENSERLWPLVLQKSLIRQTRTQKIVFRVFHFFKKGKSIKFFFLIRNTKKHHREKKRRNIKSDYSCVFYYIHKERCS